MNEYYVIMMITECIKAHDEGEAIEIAEKKYADFAPYVTEVEQIIEVGE